MANKVKSQALSIYLGKTSTGTGGDLVDPSGCKVYGVTLGEVDGTLYVPASVPHPPSWVSFLQPGVKKAIDAKVLSASAVLVLKVKSRWFAVVFGHGRHRLKAGSFEEGFGLKVCLNCIEPDKIRSIDRRTFEDGVRQGREQVSRDSDISAFGLDIEREMLRTVTAAPRKEAKLGTRISGMDALSAHVEIGLASLPAYLGKLLPHFASKQYQKDYPWVDHIAPVLDDMVIDELDAKLAELLRLGSDRVWMAVPEIIDWQIVQQFSHSLATGSRKFADLHVTNLLEHIYAGGGGVSIETLRRAKVFQYDANDQRLGHTWSAYECLYAEIEHSGTYVLSAGKWYKVAADYSSAVREAIGSIPATKIQLPPANINESEGDYNLRAAKLIPGGRLLDKKLVFLPRRVGGVEICDILHEGSNTFIHVKKWGQSAVLSHLFAQGLVSADLFLHSDEFRDAARKRIGDWVPKARPNADQHEVAFALISRSKKDLQLPFFSQVNLRACAEELKGRGYRVTLTKIQAQ